MVCQVGEAVDGLDDEQPVPRCCSVIPLQSRTLRDELARVRHGKVPNETGDGGA